ncbi:hypothetical protein C3L33_22895, partial [Rhododendron williamsianum]
MENRTPQQPQHQELINSNPNVSKMQQLVQSDHSGGWEKCWEQELTPWDLGQPTPVIVHLHQTDMPNGKRHQQDMRTDDMTFGYDVVAIACPERYVVGVDLSDKAIKKAVEFSSSLPNADYFTFLKEDFFIWHPTELFDLIFDYTFFCAIELISDHVSGPPYKVSITEYYSALYYEEVLHPLGFKAVSIVENDLAIGARKLKDYIKRHEGNLPVGEAYDENSRVGSNCIENLDEEEKEVMESSPTPQNNTVDFVLVVSTVRAEL